MWVRKLRCRVANYKFGQVCDGVRGLLNNRCKTIRFTFTAGGSGGKQAHRLKSAGSRINRRQPLTSTFNFSHAEKRLDQLLSVLF